jgi:hypothetical protein
MLGGAATPIARASLKSYRLSCQSPILMRIVKLLRSIRLVKDNFLLLIADSPKGHFLAPLDHLSIEQVLGCFEYRMTWASSFPSPWKLVPGAVSLQQRIVTMLAHQR